MKSKFGQAEEQDIEVEIDDEQYYGPQRPIQHRMRRPIGNSNKSGHWSEKENTKYYVFVLKFKQKFGQKQSRRQWKVFKALSIFVKTRDANQCRSHHHKMTKNHQTIEEALQFLRNKNPSIEQRAHRYFDQLKEIDFSTIEEGNFSQILAKYDMQKTSNKKKECDLQNQYMQMPASKEPPVKPTDPANMRTEATYGADPIEYQLPQGLSNPPYQPYPPGSYYYPDYEPLPPQSYHFQYDMMRDQLWVECHELFMKWLNKMSALVQL